MKSKLSALLNEKDATLVETRKELHALKQFGRKLIIQAWKNRKDLKVEDAVDEMFRDCFSKTSRSSFKSSSQEFHFVLTHWLEGEY